MLAPEDLDNYAEAIASIESKGSGDYGAVGKPTRTGDRAYGRYQVMGTNIPAWTYAALGQSLTPGQFLRDKDAQDKVFRHHFGSAVTEYGNTDDAASDWFTGKPAAEGANRSDGSITGAKYVQKFNKALQVARAARDPGEVDDPGDDEILKRYSPSPKGAPMAGPSDDEILKRYATPEAKPKAAVGDVAGRAADLFSSKVAGTSGSENDEKLKAAGERMHPELQPSNPFLSLKFDPHHSGLAALITPGSVDEKAARLSEWAQQWAKDNPGLAEAAGTVGGLALLRHFPGLLKHVGQVGVGAVAGDYLLSKHGIGKDLMELLGMGTK